MNLVVPVLVASLVMGSGAPAASVPDTTAPAEENSSIIVFEQTEEEKARLEEEARLQAEAEAKAAEEAAQQAMENGNYQYDIASYTTNYSTSAANTDRNYNMQLACDAINGTILLPGEEFSYNDALFAVGNPYEDYRYAGAYSNGQVVSEVGGGICQVSSTLYYCTLYANLEIVERYCHYFGVNYLPAGLDATVSWPNPDFKFKNDRDYPIKIEAYVQNGQVTVKIWGTDVDGSYVELRSTKLVVYDSVYVNTAIGYGVSAYRTVYDAEGNFLYEVEEPYGIYYRHDEDIQWPPEKYAADAAAGG